MKSTIATKAAAFGAALCAFALSAATPAMAAADEFVGLWNNPGRNAGGITQMIVTRERLGVTLEVSGDCQPRDCNWGRARGTVYSLYGDRGGPDGAIIASFTAGFSEKLIILREARGNQLTVDVFTNFTDRSGRPNTMTTLRLVRGRLGPGPGPGRGGDFSQGPPNFQGGPNVGPGNPGQGNPDQWWRQQYGQNYTYRDDPFYQQCRQTADPAGVIAGALIGGILGRALGDGRTGPTIAGVVVGGVAGAALTQNVSCEDRSYAYRTYYDGLNAGAPNRNYDWRNQATGNYGTFSVGEYYNDPYGFRCTTYSQRIYVQGRGQEATGRACKQPDGTWAIMN